MDDFHSAVHTGETRSVGGLLEGSEGDRVLVDGA